MKVLGIDYGEKRIGLAISDESQTFARELVILSPKEFWRELDLLLLNYSVEKIVLGWPLNMSGQETKKTKETENFKLQMSKATHTPIELMDERLSSQMAIRLRQGFGGLRSKNKSMSAKKDVDSLAAQILLQNYLDKMKRGEPPVSLRGQ